MQINDNGYSRNQFITGQYQDIVRSVSKNLSELMEHLNADSVAVMGKSGMSMIFGIQMIRPIPFMVVRKPNESSHGRLVEGSKGHQFKRYVILDDFVCTGETVRNIVLGIKQYCDTRYILDDLTIKPECVGVAEYQSQSCTSWAAGHREPTNYMGIRDDDGLLLAPSIPIYSLLNA